MEDPVSQEVAQSTENPLELAQRLYRPQAGEGINLNLASDAVDLYIDKNSYANMTESVFERYFLNTPMNRRTAAEAVRVIRNIDLAQTPQGPTNTEVAAAPVLTVKDQMEQFIASKKQLLMQAKESNSSSRLDTQLSVLGKLTASLNSEYK